MNGTHRDGRVESDDLTQSVLRAEKYDKVFGMNEIERMFSGTWRITHMSMWEQKFVDLVVPGFIKFDGDKSEMRFIAVRAWLDVRYVLKDGQPAADFSWQGLDERDDRCGRGTVTILPNGKLSGIFYFHMGDESAFEAVRNEN